MKKFQTLEKIVLICLSIIMASNLSNMLGAPFPLIHIFNKDLACHICSKCFFKKSIDYSQNNIIAKVVIIDIGEIYTVHEECILKQAKETIDIEDIFKPIKFMAVNNFFGYNQNLSAQNEENQKRNSILTIIHKIRTEYFANQEIFAHGRFSTDDKFCLELLAIANILKSQYSEQNEKIVCEYLNKILGPLWWLETSSYNTSLRLSCFAHLAYHSFLKKELYRGFYYSLLLNIFNVELNNSRFFYKIFKFIEKPSKYVSLQILKDYTHIFSTERSRNILYNHISFLYDSLNENELIPKSLIYTVIFQLNDQYQLSVVGFKTLNEDKFLYFLDFTYIGKCSSIMGDVIERLYCKNQIRIQSLILFIILKFGIESISSTSFIKDCIKHEFIKLFFNITDFIDPQNVQKIFMIAKNLDLKSRFLIIDFIWNTPFFIENKAFYLLYHEIICFQFQGDLDFYPYENYLEALDLKPDCKQFQNSLVELYYTTKEGACLTDYISAALKPNDSQIPIFASIFPFFLKSFASFHQLYDYSLEKYPIIAKNILDNKFFLDHLNGNLLLGYFMHSFKAFSSFDFFEKNILPHSEFFFISKCYCMLLILLETKPQDRIVWINSEGKEFFKLIKDLKDVVNEQLSIQGRNFWKKFCYNPNQRSKNQIYNNFKKWYYLLNPPSNLIFNLAHNQSLYQLAADNSSVDEFLLDFPEYIEADIIIDTHITEKHNESSHQTAAGSSAADELLTDVDEYIEAENMADLDEFYREIQENY